MKRKASRGSLLRRIFTPTRLAILGILALVGFSVFAFFYVRYAAVIDARLRGEVLIPNTGIYAAPRALRTNQAITPAALKSHLDGLGYVESSKEADSRRGRYQIKGNAIEIFTSQDAVIDGARRFPNLLVTFNQSGKAIAKITDLDTKKNLDTALLEPELLTALSTDRRQKRKLVSFQDLPKHYVNAVLAIEDRQFFEHGGINFRGIARALWRNVEEQEIQQGGSSITQQLVKNFFLTPERTPKRKLQEMMMALVLETRLSKEEIFQLYANEVFMGQAGGYSINGVGEAASTYFGKDVVNLSLPEAALLAGMLRGPSIYSPYRDPERAKARRNQVLDSMADAGFISRAEADQAKASELKVQPRRAAANSDAPYFMDYVQQVIPSQTTVAGRALRIYTTIDMDLQRAAEKAVTDTLAQLDPLYARRKKNPVPPGTLQAALVAMHAETGEILAMVGGRDYEKSQLNRAVDANRQPGSVFKPIVFAAALNSAYEGSEEAITPASLFMDAPETFYYGRGENYQPQNFGKSYSNREVTLRDALAHSLNVVTVRVAEKVGYGQVARMAQQLGLPKPPALPSVALGAAEATPLQVASAYTAFANQGRRARPMALKQITNANGAPLSETRVESERALRPEIAWLMTSLMRDVLNRGTAARARALGFGGQAAGKTGTSRDGWFAGYTPNLVCVVRVGFDDNTDINLEGSKSALPIWASFMKQALQARPDLGGSFPDPPDGIESVEIDPTTGMRATGNCPAKREEYFIEGTAPETDCTTHSSELPMGAPIPLPFEWPEGKPDSESEDAPLEPPSPKRPREGERRPPPDADRRALPPPDRRPQGREHAHFKGKIAKK